jgi:predicted alpha/beta hydrolase
MNDQPTIQGDPFRLTTSDHFEIGCTAYRPTIPTKGHILLAGATAVPQSFYRRFANHAAQQGFMVTTLDYRGVGTSAPKSLRGMSMNYLDWGRQDLVRTLDHISANTSLPIFMVGHSYGGHGFGLMPNHAKIKRFYTYGTGAGWAGYMSPFERLKVNIMWHLLGPALVSIYGYMPGKAMGLGEDLPKAVYLQWKAWCQHPNYFFDDPNMNDELKHFAQVTTPIIAAVSTDDLWITPPSRDAFFKGYANAPVQAVNINPKQFGITNPVGHIGYFRKGHESLWQPALDWFDQAL